MKKYWIGLFLVASSLCTTAQETVSKKELTLKEAVLGGWGHLAPERLQQINWIPNTDYYAFLKEDVLVKRKATSKKNIKLVDLKSLSAKLSDELKRFPRIHWLNSTEFYFTYKHTIYVYNIKSKSLSSKTSFDQKATHTDIDKKTFNVAYTADHNLYIQKGKDAIQVTKDGGNGIINGEAVHRYEFGIYKGTFWSPKSNKLAFYRKDESMVTDYPLVNYNARTAELNNIKYPMAGMKSHHVKLGVYDLNSQKTTFLKIDGPKEQYLTNIAWDPSGEFIYVVLVNRDQNHIWLNKYNANTGEFVVNLREEINDKYIEPTHPIQFIGDGFLWQSEIDGLNKFYYFSKEGKLVSELNTEQVIVQQFLNYDKKSDRLLFAGNYANEIEQQLFVISVKKPKAQILKQLTFSGSDHRSLKVSTNGKYTIDQYSNLENPRSIDVLNNKSKKSVNILSSKNPLENYITAQTEIIDLKADDGTKLYGRMIKPHDFDEKKKYPALVYVYNGPNVQLIRNNWLASASLWMHYFANKGYVVFTVDGRGSANRGMDFEQATYRKLGQVEMKDQVTAAEYLKSLPYVDGDKMGVHGWSYGGFMTVSLMLNYPDLFKVAVAGGPVIDWSLYEIMYTERYMDTPKTNKEGFKLTSTLDKTKNLKGKLMLIHGADDDVVVMQHSMKFLKSCIDNEKQVDFFVYPGHKHNVRGIDRVHLMDKVLKYIEEGLK